MTGPRGFQVVRGQATDDDVSALHSVLHPTPASVDALARWRSLRRAALRLRPESVGPPGRR